MKLSSTQGRILSLLSNGWELGSSGGFDTFYWMQEGGLGRGGKTETIKSSTVWSLLNKGLIKGVKRSIFLTVYEPTNLNK